MLFNSLQFLCFFPIVTALYFLLPHRFRWQLLLVASCYFYMALIPAYVLILFFLIFVDYSAGLLIEQATGARRKPLLLLSLAANLGVLVFFKYFNFLNANLEALTGFLGVSWHVRNLEIVLPVGLSFHTFQSISYTIEVYLGRQRAERHLGIYALYVMFYPQLVAGPIERPQNLLHQFVEEHRFEYGRVTDGLKLMAWGFFKKVVIADRLAGAVALVYDNPHAFTGLPLLVATYCFAVQIYCDFSGYSDIARGAARVMGFNLMNNFNRPYHARSVADFWHRWHISLSTWFRDYLYIPLGGNRVWKCRWWYVVKRDGAEHEVAAGERVWKLRWYCNLFLVFLASGLWHGASWTFVAWGALHGSYLLVSLWTRGLRQRLGRLLGLERAPAALLRGLQVFLTFNLVAFAWIFFRAQSLEHALYIVRHLFVFGPDTVGYFALQKKDLLVALVAVVVLEAAHLVQRRQGLAGFLSRQPALVRWPAYYALVYGTLFFGKFGSQQFIYFQF
jgi:D-alanyl-lipoteichoic acid acyltransferase DltB (MBOAT superfamily)